MLENKKDYKAWLYIALPLILLSLFTFYPLIKTVLISFFSGYNSIADDFGTYFDAAAYMALFKDPYYIGALNNNVTRLCICSNFNHISNTYCCSTKFN